MCTIARLQCMNIRGLISLSNRTKVSKICTWLSYYNALFMGVTETHLNANNLDDEIGMDVLHISMICFLVCFFICSCPFKGPRNACLTVMKYVTIHM